MGPGQGPTFALPGVVSVVVMVAADALPVTGLLFPILGTAPAAPALYVLLVG